EGLLLVEAGAPGAELQPSVAHDVEHRGALSDADRMIEWVGQQDDAVPDPDALRACRDTSEKYFRSRGVREFIEKVMLHLPQSVETHCIRKFRLRQRLPVAFVLAAFVPRLEHLHLVEQVQLHHALPASVCRAALARRARAASRAQ